MYIWWFECFNSIAMLGPQLAMLFGEAYEVWACRRKCVIGGSLDLKTCAILSSYFTSCLQFKM